MGNPSPSGYRHQSKASPLKRIRLARGLSMAQLAVYSDTSQKTIQKIDRLDPKNIGTLKLDMLMRVAITLECSPVDLIPFLGTRVKGQGKTVAKRTGNQGKFQIGEERSVNPTGGFGKRDG
jgi:transcriptional regulator with XRE-family HTH domain